MIFTFSNCCRALALLASFGLAGCSPKKNASPPSVSGEVALAAAPIAPEPAEELESAGAKISRDVKSGKIVAVDLSGIEVTDEMGLALSALRDCKKLTLTHSVMSDAGWASLSGLGSLEQFDVRDCPLSNHQLQSALSGMPELRALRMSGQSGATTVDDAGLAVLANCPKLKVLAIDELWIGSDGLKHLATCTQLAELYMKGSLVEDDSMALVADMKNLKKLRLAKTAVGSVGLQTISQLPLQELDVSECSHVLDESMQFVGRMQTLKRLNLWRDVVSDVGLGQLATLTSLEWLNLDNTHVTDAGLVHLKGFAQLAFLHLGSTAVSDAGMSQLTSLGALKDLKVTRTSVTEAGAAIVRQSIPAVSVQLKYIEGQ